MNVLRALFLNPWTYIIYIVLVVGVVVVFPALAHPAAFTAIAGVSVTLISVLIARGSSNRALSEHTSFGLTPLGHVLVLTTGLLIGIASVLAFGTSGALLGGIATTVSTAAVLYARPTRLVVGQPRLQDGALLVAALGVVTGSVLAVYSFVF